MTAIMIAQMGSAALTAAKLDTTITVGSDVWIVDGTEDVYFAYGYNDALSDPVGLGGMGSMSETTYTDGGSTLQEISSVIWTEPTGGLSPTFDDNLYFGLIGTSIANTDTTFREIEYNGIIYTRASNDLYQASVGGVATFWQWDNVSPNPPSSGVRSFLVRL